MTDQSWTPDLGAIYAATVTYELVDGSTTVIDRPLILWDVADDDSWLVTFADEHDKPNSRPLVIPGDVMRHAADYRDDTMRIHLGGIISGRHYRASDPAANSIPIMVASYRDQLALLRSPLELVDDASRRLTRLAASTETVTQQRDAAIRHALASRDPDRRDGTVQTIMAATGLSRARIYQIRDAGTAS